MCFWHETFDKNGSENFNILPCHACFLLVKVDRNFCVNVSFLTFLSVFIKSVIHFCRESWKSFSGESENWHWIFMKPFKQIKSSCHNDFRSLAKTRPKSSQNQYRSNATPDETKVYLILMNQKVFSVWLTAILRRAKSEKQTYFNSSFLGKIDFGLFLYFLEKLVNW